MWDAYKLWLCKLANNNECPAPQHPVVYVTPVVVVTVAAVALVAAVARR